MSTSDSAWPSPTERLPTMNAASQSSPSAPVTTRTASARSAADTWRSGILYSKLSAIDDAPGRKGAADARDSQGGAPDIRRVVHADLLAPGQAVAFTLLTFSDFLMPNVT